jgi:SAM-dependent methyltransferase
VKKVTHTAQQKAWDAEHKNPSVLVQMDSQAASSGVEKFFDFLQNNKMPYETGVEMGCGKGRNVIWLAKKGIEAVGFDFSPAAIKVAKSRAKGTTAKFIVSDATKKWPFKSNSFDFGVDCFASTDIESEIGRRKALKEMIRVLKPGGYLMAYLHAVGAEFHKHVTKVAPGHEKNSFVRGDGKYEKIFNDAEIKRHFKGLKILEKEIIEKSTNFGDEKYPNKHYWLVFQKPH